MSLVNEIGDCELDTPFKTNPNLASALANELVAEILADALDIVEDKPEQTCSKGLGDQLEPLGEDPQVKHRAVVKKSRLTDLVKSSKHALAKLIQHDCAKEIGPEKVLRVVELDSGDQPYKIHKQLGEVKLWDKGTQKEEVVQKTMTFPMAGSSGKRPSLAGRYRTLKLPAELKTTRWNFGTKIVNYIRKHQGKKHQASEGVEIEPSENDS